MPASVCNTINISIDTAIGFRSGCPFTHRLLQLLLSGPQVRLHQVLAKGTVRASSPLKKRLRTARVSLVSRRARVREGALERFLLGSLTRKTGNTQTLNYGQNTQSGVSGYERWCGGQDSQPRERNAMKYPKNTKMNHPTLQMVHYCSSTRKVVQRSPQPPA